VPKTAHSSSLPFTSLSMRIFLSRSPAILSASFNLSLPSTLLIPTEEPEFEGLTKTGNDNSFSTFSQSSSIFTLFSLKFLST